MFMSHCSYPTETASPNEIFESTLSKDRFRFVICKFKIFEQYE